MTEIERNSHLEGILETISQWDCPNPPRADLLGDLPWLRRLVDERHNKKVKCNMPNVEVIPEKTKQQTTVVTIQVVRCICGRLLAGYNSETVTTSAYLPQLGACNHDDNCRVRDYFCECGLKTPLSIINKCPCGWVGKTECFCSEKVELWP